MDTAAQRDVNEAAYRQLKETIAKAYPHGHFVAISGGEIVADAPTFLELNALLHARGYHAPDVLAVEAGVNYPEYVTFLGIAL
jgi:pyruvate-formate lyase-activating enzyme